jgi:hypothetical protein
MKRNIRRVITAAAAVMQRPPQAHDMFSVGTMLNVASALAQRTIRRGSDGAGAYFARTQGRRGLPGRNELPGNEPVYL